MSFSPLTELQIMMSAVASSVTGTTTETVLATATVKKGMVAAGDVIIGYANFSYTNSANTKTLKFKANGTAIWSSNVTTTASLMRWIVLPVVSLSSQIAVTSASSTGIGASANAIGAPTTDYSADVTFDLTGTLTNTGETITLEHFQFVVMKAP